MIFPSYVVLSGRLGSGQVGRPHLASGSVGSGLIVSGAIASGNVGFGTPDTTTFLRGDLQWVSPGAASVTSGAIAQDKIASGLMIKDVALLVSGYNPITSGMTEEAISGVRAVAVSQSGNLRIAMASVSGRMPAIGVVINNVASGIQVDVHQLAMFVPTSGLVELSGYGSQPLYVGRSGQIVTCSGSFNSAGFNSGDLIQPAGLAVQAFSGVGNPQVIAIAIDPATIPYSFGITSGNVASGQIGRYHLASGSVGSGLIVSGAIASGNVGFGSPDTTTFLRGDLQWTTPAGGSLTSGAVGQDKVASGLMIDDVAVLISGYNPLTSGMTEEAISGVRAVTISQSGNIRIAMASVSGRMPAVGVVIDNVASGIQCNVHQFCLFNPTSGLVEISGYGSQLLYVGRSGQIVTSSGSFNSGGLLSGDVSQPVGYAVQDVSGPGNPKPIMIGIAATLPFVPSLVYSGNIASGNVDTYHFASGATVSVAQNVTPIWSGSLIFDAISSETISGIRAVCFQRGGSGAVRIAMTMVSGRMPAMGVVADNVLSGIAVNVIVQGSIVFTSGLTASGLIGKCVHVGRSGQLVPWSGSFNSAGWISGEMTQRIGCIAAQSSGATSGTFVINVDYSTYVAASGMTPGIQTNQLL